MGLEGTGHGSGIRMEAAAYDGRDLAAAEGVTSSLCTWRQPADQEGFVRWEFE